MSQAPAVVGDVKNVRGFLTQMKDQLAMALPKHIPADRLIRVALTTCQKNPALLQCETKSLLGAIMECGELGVMPDGVLGEAHLVPFNNRARGVKECQLIIGYQGMIRLSQNSGDVLDIRPEVVYAKDEFSYEYGLDPKLKHVPASGDRGEMIGVYAVAIFKNDYSSFRYFSKADIEKTKSQAMGNKKNTKDSPWEKYFEAMAMKTAIRKIWKYLPKSSEKLSTAVALDELADAGISQGLSADLVVIPEDQVKNIESADVQPGDAESHTEPGEPITAGAENGGGDSIL